MIEILKELKDIKNESFIVEDIADFYESKPETIRTILKRNRKTFEYYGELVTMRGEELNSYREKYNGKISNKVRSLTLMNSDGVIRIGLYISTPVSKKVRLRLNEIEIPEKYTDVYIDSPIPYKSKENKLKDILYATFNGICSIKDQVVCGNYSIDFVFNERVAVECDEFGHKYYDPVSESERDSFIKGMGYEVIRFNPDGNDSVFNLINTILHTINTNKAKIIT